ncbi:MAG: glutaredoxin domain-containing protein [Nitrospiria bacterium]
MIKIYGRDGCPMCKDAVEWLDLKEIPYQFREIFREPLTQAELSALAEKLPNRFYDLYAPKGARKVGLPENARELSPGKIVSLQQENPDLIRYPIFDLGDELLFGFYDTTKSALLRNNPFTPFVE